MNKNYESGKRFEYRVRDYLEKKGYYVMRSAGSKSPFDLIAVPTKRFTITRSTLLIQCKHGAKISKQERNELNLLSTMYPKEIEVMVAWSKTHGKIEFYQWYLSLRDGYQWIKTEVN